MNGDPNKTRSALGLDANDRWHKQYDAKKREERKTLVIGVLIVLALLGLTIAGAALLYGDWTCAFIECRKIVK